MAEWIEVKNFTKFQHYRERRPPWIKLHGSVFDNYEFTELADATKLLLIGLWVLASRTDNRIPNKPKWIRGCLHLTERLNLAPLVEAGFITLHNDDASTPHAPRKQEPMIEKRREETQLHTEKNPEVIRKLVLESLGSSHEQTGKARASA